MRRTNRHTAFTGRTLRGRFDRQKVFLFGELLVLLVVIDLAPAVRIVDRHDRVFIVKHRLDARIGTDVDTPVLFEEDDVDDQEQRRDHQDAHEDKVFARMRQVREKIFRRNEVPQEVRRCQQRQRGPDRDRDDALGLVLRFAPVGLLLLAQVKQFRLDQVAVDDAEDRLRTDPAAEHAPAQHGHAENTDEHDHQDERHEVHLLHIELHEREFQFQFVETQEENVVSVDRDPRQNQRHDGKP